MKHTITLVLALGLLAGCTAATSPSTSPTLPASSSETALTPAPMAAPMVVASQQAGNEVDAMARMQAQMLAETNNTTPQAIGGEPLKITVHKSASCGCCEAWIKHLEANGFLVSVANEADMNAVKDHFHIPASRRSCHTGEIDGMFVEGHVPADDIRKLVALKKKGQAVDGIAVPGMPTGSPGMEFGDTHEHYDVYALTGSKETVFASH